MKLWLRSIESKETLTVEAPNPCSLRQLKHMLSQNLHDSPSPASIRLSLNRKDELRSTAPGAEDSLQLLGVSSGDLIFFSIDFPPVSEPVVGMDSFSENIHPGNTVSESQISEFEKRKTLDTATQLEESVDCMDLEDDCDDKYNIRDGFSADVVGKSFSVPRCLRKVFIDEFKNDCVLDHKLSMVLAIHAVFSESGFVGFDRNSNKETNSFQFKNDWPSSFIPSLSYTLPDVVSRGDGIDSIVLKFQTLGKFMSVYGSLENDTGGHGTHCLKFNEDQLVPHLNAVWENRGITESVEGFAGGVSTISPEKELFKFRRDVRDNLALPLLIGLCEKAGLELHPCFIKLPKDLMMRILELLPGVDVARISCVCSDLRSLASSYELWQIKFNELWQSEFNEPFRTERTEGHGSWKEAFAMFWGRAKHRRVEDRMIPVEPRRIRHPNPSIVARGPCIVGGPRDLWPAFGGDTLTRLRGPVNPLMRNFSPPCKLGGRSSGRFI